MRAFLLAQWLSIAGPVAGAHEVASGENLWGIARAHGVTVAELRAANPELREPLRVGTALSVPAKASASPESPAKTAPKAAKAAANAHAKAKAAAETAAKAKAAKAKRKPEPEPTAEPRVHEVVAGDTLGALAKRHGLTVAEIQRRNGLSSATIVVGQRLVVGDALLAEAQDARPELPDLADLPPPPDGDIPSAAPEAKRRAAAVASAVRSTAGTSGRLVGAVRLPHDRTYYLRHPTRAWGLPHVVTSTRAAIAAVKKKHPGVHRLAIGDISAKGGGRLSGHKSHRAGRDVDIGLYFRRVPEAYPKRFVGADSAPLDHAATWALIEAFYNQSKRPGGPIQIFLDFGVQGEIYAWARKHGVSRRVLSEVFQHPHGRWARRGLVRHEPAHDDHLHVRFACPRGGTDC